VAPAAGYLRAREADTPKLKLVSKLCQRRAENNLPAAMLIRDGASEPEINAIERFEVKLFLP